MYWRLKNLYTSIKNLIIWFPIIWNDRQWDEMYLLTILELKLKIMEKHFRKFGMHINAEKDADKMRICKILCRRIINDDYTSPWDKRNEVEHAKFRDLFENWISRDNNEPLIIPDGSDDPETKYILMECKHKDYQGDQDIEYLFKLLRKHLKTWWD